MINGERIEWTFEDIPIISVLETIGFLGPFKSYETHTL